MWAFALALLLLFAPHSLGGFPQQATAGPAVVAETRFRLVRVQAGAAAREEAGRFVITDPRTTFYVPGDREVVVYFEWEGPTGPHALEALWKNPEGKVVVVSDLTYEAKQPRFGAYWKLLLTDALPRGLWTVEARVDGEVAGVFHFQVVAGQTPPPAPDVAPELTAGEIYRLATANTVFIERLDPAGLPVGRGSGFVLSPGDLLATNFHVIEAAARLRLLLADGSSVETDEVLAWNRRQNWALLRLNPPRAPGLVRARPNSWAVGDRVYSLDNPTELNRTLLDGNLIGNFAFPHVGERLDVSLSGAPSASGAPLLNARGEVIAIFLPSGAWWGHLTEYRSSYPGNMWRAGALHSMTLAIPLSILPNGVPATTTSLAHLHALGLFAEPLAESPRVNRGTVCKRVNRHGNPALVPTAEGEAFEFLRGREKEAVVFVEWDAGKGRFQSQVRIYDLDNRLKAQSRPGKLNLSDVFVHEWWTVSLAGLEAGIYRADVYVGNKPVWRTYFRVKD